MPTHQSGKAIDRRDFLKILPALGATVASPAGAQTRRKPNILVIVTDDHGIGDVGLLRPSRSPHAQSRPRRRLRRTLHRMVLQRSDLFRFPRRDPDRQESRPHRRQRRAFLRTHLGRARAGETTLPGQLRKPGYNTAAFGKWHLGSAPPSRPMNQGFDSFFGWYSGWLDAYSHRYDQLGGPHGKIFHDLWRNETESSKNPRT